MTRVTTKMVIGSIRPGVATLVSEDHEVLDFPSHMLPVGVFVGAVVELSIAVRPEHQVERLASINALFEDVEAEASSEKVIHRDARPGAARPGAAAAPPGARGESGAA